MKKYVVAVIEDNGRVYAKTVSPNISKIKAIASEWYKGIINNYIREEEYKLNMAKDTTKRCKIKLAAVKKRKGRKAEAIARLTTFINSYSEWTKLAEKNLKDYKKLKTQNLNKIKNWSGERIMVLRFPYRIFVIVLAPISKGQTITETLNKVKKYLEKRYDWFRTYKDEVTWQPDFLRKAGIKV